MTDDDLILQTRNALRGGATLKGLAQRYDVSHGVIQRLRDGIAPMGNDIRHKLGLTEKVTIAVCGYCGKPHRKKYCAKTPFAERLGDHPDKQAILAVYRFLESRNHS